ncbi:MAG: amidohydrolase 2 [Chloroflexi bacterium]|nr:amidohydrolase 2 [Chloroflexota bacterium]
MPDVPIVDSHLHLWDPTRFRMAWLDGDEVLEKPFGLQEYREHSAGLDIAAMVYLQVDVDPAYGVLEAQWATALAAQDPRIQGIVPWAPLEYGDRVRIILEALHAISPLIKGVRRLIQAESDVEFCLRPDFVRGVQLLPEYDFTFDICINDRQLASVVKLVRQCPGTQFILDHLGKPDIAHRALSPWREHLAELASLPNVMCKLSGMVTEADRRNWTVDDLRPFASHVLEVFGEDRVAFGGDWPVVLGASSYKRWVETADQLTAHLRPEAQKKFWSENARRFYRLA